MQTHLHKKKKNTADVYLAPENSVTNTELKEQAEDINMQG